MNEIDNPSNTQYVADEIEDGDISCDQACWDYGKEPWMCRKTAAEAKNERGVRNQKKQNRVGERITHDKKC